MATTFTFNNQVIELPGSYSQFVSGVTNPPLRLSFGNVLLIDTGQGSGYGAGAGIDGKLSSGATAVYQADDLRSFREAVGGGIFWDIAKPLFQPNGPGGGNGVSRLFYARAATTIPAEVTLGYTSGANGGTAIIQAKNEGTVGNGVEGDQTLSSTVATLFETTVVGATADAHTINVTDPKSGLTAIGTHIVIVGDTTTTIATGLASSINNGTSGYRAISTGPKVSVEARDPQGLEDATDFNAIVSTYTSTGTAAGTSGVFAGAVDGTLLTRGYSVTMSKGEDDPTLFFIQLWRGTYKGKDISGYVWDEIEESATLPQLIATSPEFSDIKDLHTWMETNPVFGSSFKLKSKTVVGTGIIVAGDLATNANNNVFFGGTEVYSTANLDLILDQVQGLDYSLILASGYEDNAQSSDNGKLLAHIADGDTFGDKLMIIGGGSDSTKFEEGTTFSSIETAKSYNNDRVVVCHGSPIKTTNLNSEGFIKLTTLHKAASICGRIAGLQPQVPITFKTLKIDGELHKLSLKEQKRGLRKGVLMTIPDRSLIRVLQGVNSIQNNSYLVNSDATTHSIQLRRMMAQINKELVVNATEQLLKNPNGTNRNTLSASDIKTFTEGYLKGRTATATTDDMVISFRNVNVILDNDAYKVSYDIIFNTEITKIFFTGTVFLSF